jgi:hypothetical protein
VREFLARKKIEPEFDDIRKAPVSKAATVAIVRKHTRALAKVGGKL